VGARSAEIALGKRACPLLERVCAPALHALAALSLCAFAACVHPPPLPPPPVDPAPGASAAELRANAEAAESLLLKIRAAHQQPVTVSGDAKAFVDAEQNGGRYALMFALRRPDALRIDALMPWGEPAASLVTSGGKLLFRDDRRKEFYRGASTPRNLSLLLPAPLTDRELIDLLAGAMPELPGADAFSVEDAGDGKKRLVLRTQPPGLVTTRGLIQSALVAPDLTVLEVSRYLDGGGKTELLWAATLEEQGGAGAPGLPSLVHFHIAADSVGQKRDVEIDLRLKNLTAGHAPPVSAFTLLPPPEMKIIELDGR